MLRAVIFDMDGVLIDSEPLWVRAEIEIFGEVGIVLDEAECAKTKGLRVDDVVRYRHARNPWTTRSLAEVEAKLVALVAALVREEGRALPGVDEALAAARAKGCRVALASSSPMTIITATLERLGLTQSFDAVCSCENEPFGKPHPSVFLTTASRLNVEPTACLVIEDSLAGVIAARAARMACIAVPFDWPAQDPRFVLADATVGSLDAIDAALLTEISGTR